MVYKYIYIYMAYKQHFSAFMVHGSAPRSTGTDAEVWNCKIFLWIGNSVASGSYLRNPSRSGFRAAMGGWGPGFRHGVG